MVATETLVEGFRVSTGQWMNSAFPFDISVMGNDIASSVYGNQALPPSLISEVRQVQGVQRVYGVRKILTPVSGQDAMVIGVDINDYIAARRDKHLGPWPPGMNDPEIQKQFRSGSGTFISVNFAKLYRKRPGEILGLLTPTGHISLKILGEIDDYSWPHGCFIVNRPVLQMVWKDDSIS